MKIGITSKVLTHWRDDGYSNLRKLGFSCLDYDMSNTETPLYLASEEEFRTMLLHEKQLASEAGIEISQVHGPWRWPVMDETEENRAERMEKMQKSIRACSLLGCKNWVVHPVMPFGHCDLELGKGAETWEINMEFMNKLVKTARENDVTICLENMPMPMFSIATPADIMRVVKEINDEHFKMCLDTGHVAIFPDLSLGDTVREWHDYIRVLHIHDNNGKVDQHLIPYFGVIDWADFGKALREVGFNGSFSFETEPPSKLPSPMFEELCATFIKIAKHIMSDD